MSILFSPTKLKNMTIRNRFVRSATYDGSSEKTGHVSERQIRLYSKLADGGVGLIVTGIMYVHPKGKISPHMNSIAGPEYVPGLRELTKTVHESGAKIAVQLFHGGRASSGYYNYKKELAVAPSYVSNDSGFIGDYRPMTEEEIWEAIQSFGDAAVRVQEAGFDAVQVHGAHGYLLSQFLSPFTNRREDDWGGNLQNRLRFHYEVYKSIRERVGKDYPVMIKIGVQDEVPGGLRLSEGIQTARSMAEWGFDALEISQGLRGARWEGTEQRAHIRSREQEAYFRAWCQAVEKKVDIPVMMVGGLRSPDLMEEIIQQGEADFISLCRPLIREPGIIREWERGRLRKSACISCNKCYETIEEGKPLACFIEEKRNTQGDV